LPANPAQISAARTATEDVEWAGFPTRVVMVWLPVVRPTAGAEQRSRRLDREVKVRCGIRC